MKDLMGISADDLIKARMIRISGWVAKSFMADSKTAIRMVQKREFYRPDPDRYQNVEQIKVPQDVDLEIWKYEMGGVLYGVAFQGRGQKPIWQYRFRNENEFEKTVRNTIQNRQSDLEYKKKKQEERSSYRHDYQVGDFLYTSWGYDQTNIDFYQVVGITDKSVVIREVASKVVRSNPPQDYVVPQKNRFTGPKMTKRVSPGGSVRIKSYAHASKWDGKPKYETSSGWGH